MGPPVEPDPAVLPEPADVEVLAEPEPVEAPVLPDESLDAPVVGVPPPAVPQAGRRAKVARNARRVVWDMVGSDGGGG